MNILAPSPILVGFLGMQYLDIDFLSRENLRVNFLVHFLSMSLKTALADSSWPPDLEMA